MTIQRWNPFSRPDHGMATEPEGEWVRYSDHLAEIEKKMCEAFEAGVHTAQVGIDYENGETVGGAFASYLRQLEEKKT